MSATQSSIDKQRIVSTITYDKWMDIDAQINGKSVFTLQGGTQSNQFAGIAFPIVRRVMVGTIAGGSPTSKQIADWEAEITSNKLKHVLEGESLKDIPMPEGQGLLSVIPMSAPTGKLFFLDYKHEKVTLIGRVLDAIKKYIKLF